MLGGVFIGRAAPSIGVGGLRRAAAELLPASGVAPLVKLSTRPLAPCGDCPAGNGDWCIAEPLSDVFIVPSCPELRREPETLMLSPGRRSLMRDAGSSAGGPCTTGNPPPPVYGVPREGDRNWLLPVGGADCCACGCCDCCWLLGSATRPRRAGSVTASSSRSNSVGVGPPKLLPKSLAASDDCDDRAPSAIPPDCSAGCRRTSARAMRCAGTFCRHAWIRSFHKYSTSSLYGGSAWTICSNSSSCPRAPPCRLRKGKRP
mmetsp:Transcript_19487/g.60517  ORF Transcript_19487/g.60517 Transcript_19487/m.60517 type:complete len:260 (+) Transcript_19487:246-1025(+)